MPPKVAKASSTKKSPAKAAGKSKASPTKKKAVAKKPTVTKKKPTPKKPAPGEAKPTKPKAKASAAATKKPKEAAKPKAAAKKPASPKKPAAAAGAKKAAAAKKPTVAKKSAASPKKKPAAAAKKPAAPKKAATKASGPLEVGSDAPDFTVKDQSGSDVSLSSFKGEKNVVVFFYPKDNTPGCTKEACSFRDLKSEYEALECVVLGVSADHETSHGKFIAKYNLNFSLLADTNRALIKSYGASKGGDKIQRSSVLINKEGKVAAVWNPVKGAEQHPNEVLAKLKEMS